MVDLDSFVYAASVNKAQYKLVKKVTQNTQYFPKNKHFQLQRIILTRKI